VLKILNRFAWISSIFWWFVLLFLFWVLVDEMDWQYSTFLDDDFFFGWIFFSTIIWMIFKKIFLSEKFIKSHISSENILKEEKIINIPYNKEELIDSLKHTWDLAINIAKDKANDLLRKHKNKEITSEEYELQLAKEAWEAKKHEANKNTEVLESNTEIKKDIPKPFKIEKYEPSAFVLFFESLWRHIKTFFSTNLLAKLGSILVFLAVVYFLKWVALDFWKFIWEVWRIIIGIIIGFSIYFVWLKVHKKSENEWLILMWTWILINYAVILSGRYLIWDWWYLTEWTTSFFLVLNTVFAVLTSLIYKSKVLLIFSFVFAYLIPFIIWADVSSDPYTLISYSLVVSLWWLFLAKMIKNNTLLVISFVAWNWLFLLAPFSDSLWWASKIILTTILSIITIKIATLVIARRDDEAIQEDNINKDKADVSDSGLPHSAPLHSQWQGVLFTFIWSYIFVILNLINSTYNSINVLSENLSFIVYNIIILSLFIFTIKLLLTFKKSDWLALFLLSLPLLILIWILLWNNLLFAPFVLIFTIIFYLIWFIFLQWILLSFLNIILFCFLAAFILIFNIDFVFWSWDNLIRNTIEFFTILSTTFIFLYSSYFYSRKKDLSSLYPVWTIWTIILLWTIITNKFVFENNADILTSIPINWSEVALSVIAIFIFAFANWILPFVNKDLLKKENLNKLVIWTIAWALFFAFQVYNFWELHFPWVIEGLAFWVLAIIYFIQAYFISQKIWIENMKNDESAKNIFYNFAWISISFFSVAIAFVFSKYPEIVSTTWLFEATILYYFYSKNSSKKIFLAATVLFFIWLTKFLILTDVVGRWDFSFLISFIIIFASFILNLFFINKTEGDSALKITHNILHLIWMAIMSALLIKIIPNTWHWWSLLWVSTFLWVLWSFYAMFNFKFLKIVFLMVISLFLFIHFWQVDYLFSKFEREGIEYFKILQYLVTIILIFNVFIWNNLNKNLAISSILRKIMWVYVFIITSMYFYDIFENTLWYFSLTLYWGLIASTLFIYWVQKDLIKFRTIWLYFLTLTSAKIFLYDVWEIWDTNSRVLTFAVLWVIFIVISILYTRKYWDNLSWEFNLKNLK